MRTALVSLLVASLLPASLLSAQEVKFTVEQPKVGHQVGVNTVIEADFSMEVKSDGNTLQTVDTNVTQTEERLSEVLKVSDKGPCKWRVKFGKVEKTLRKMKQ